MSAVVRAFNANANRLRSRPWQNHELAEFYRVIDILGRAGLGIVPDMGISDEGEPWFAFCRADTGEVVVHCARIDGCFMATSIASSEVFYGNELRDLVNSILKSKHFASVTPIADRRLYLHPAAIFTAFIAAALLMSQHAHAADSDSSPAATPPVDGAAFLKFFAAVKLALTDAGAATIFTNGANEPIYFGEPNSFDAPLSLGALMAGTLAVLPVDGSLDGHVVVPQADAQLPVHIDASHAALSVTTSALTALIHDTAILPVSDSTNSLPVFGGGEGDGNSGGTGGIDVPTIGLLETATADAPPVLQGSVDSSSAFHFNYVPAPSLHPETFAVMAPPTTAVQQTLTPAGHVFDISQITSVALEIFTGSPTLPTDPDAPPPTDTHASDDGTSDSATPATPPAVTTSADNTVNTASSGNSITGTGTGNDDSTASNAPSESPVDNPVLTAPTATTATTVPSVINMAANPTLGIEHLVDYAYGPYQLNIALHESALLAATLGTYAAGGEALPVLVVFDSASVSQSIFSLRSDILFVDDHELGILPQQALAANLVTVEPVGGPAMTLLGVIDPSHAVF